MIETIKIILADDQDLFRKGISSLLKDEANFEVIFEAASGTILLDYLQKNNPQPHIILMDMKMPDLNGVEATKQIFKAYPAIKIIALSSYITATFISGMISGGAVSYLPKNATPTEMITTINRVFEQGYYHNSYMLQHFTKKQLDGLLLQKNRTATDFFTKKEHEILKLICQQKSTTQIAEILDISPRTVEGHRKNMFFKTDCNSIAGLIIFALQYNFFSLDDTVEI
jgi:DNA-binding NarL/FixJ family response regulator